MRVIKMNIQLDEKAPDFTLNDDQELPFRLSAHAGRRLLLVFYPGDDTPVCTRQLCEYRDGIGEFRDLGVEVIGISRDDAASHRRFKEKHALPFRLLSDPDLGVAEQYGCRGIMGMKRGVFLLDEQHTVRYAHVETISVFRRRKDELVDAISRL